MKYTVLQIPFPETDKEEKIFHEYAYKHLDWIDKVHPEYYKKTYEGNLETSSTDVMDILEEIFTELNINWPADYTGHSLSISDIVKINNRYYYCDAYGWKEVDFNVL